MNRIGKLGEVSKLEVFSNEGEILKRAQARLTTFSSKVLQAKFMGIDKGVFEKPTINGSKIKDGILIVEASFKKGYRKARFLFSFDIRNGEVNNINDIFYDMTGNEYELNRSGAKLALGIKEDGIVDKTGKLLKKFSWKKKAQIEEEIKDPAPLKFRPDAIKPFKTQGIPTREPSEKERPIINDFIKKSDELIKDIAKFQEQREAVDKILNSRKKEQKELGEEIYKHFAYANDIIFMLGNRVMQILTLFKSSERKPTDKEILVALESMPEVKQQIDLIRAKLMRVETIPSPEVTITNPQEEKPITGQYQPSLEVAPYTETMSTPMNVPSKSEVVNVPQSVGEGEQINIPTSVLVSLREDFLKLLSLISQWGRGINKLEKSVTGESVTPSYPVTYPVKAQKDINAPFLKKWDTKVGKDTVEILEENGTWVEVKVLSKSNNGVTVEYNGEVFTVPWDKVKTPYEKGRPLGAKKEKITKEKLIESWKKGEVTEEEVLTFIDND